MRTLAESDGDVFLPNPEPNGPVDYILICMEPSLGRWARSPAEARRKVQEGFRNFLYSMEDFILHFCARRYLCDAGERYHITDFSKGAMLVTHAAVDRQERYDRWYELLLAEIELVGTPQAGIVAVGSAVARHLERRGFPRPFTRIIHYSGQAAWARNEGIRGREQEFETFKASVSHADLITTARDVLEESDVPDDLRDATLTRLERQQLTPSRKRLMFSYKLAFEAL